MPADPNKNPLADVPMSVTCHLAMEPEEVVAYMVGKGFAHQVVKAGALENDPCFKSFYNEQFFLPFSLARMIELAINKEIDVHVFTWPPTLVSVILPTDYLFAGYQRYLMVLLEFLDSMDPGVQQAAWNQWRSQIGNTSHQMQTAWRMACNSRDRAAEKVEHRQADHTLYWNEKMAGWLTQWEGHRRQFLALRATEPKRPS